MFLNAGGFDKVKAAERGIHGLNFSDQDRPDRYHHDHEMSKAAFEKEQEAGRAPIDKKKFIVKALEVAVLVVATGVLIQFFGGLF